MALEAMPNYNDIFNFMLYETLNANQYGCSIGTTENAFVPVADKPDDFGGVSTLNSSVLLSDQHPTHEKANQRANLGVQGRKKRRRRAKVCKNKEEAETQRMTHIKVERNRRKQINEHLAVLRSLMPESYAQRGDQASIVGGAIAFVKELEHLVHSLEAQKFLPLQQADIMGSRFNNASTSILNDNLSAPSFTEFFSDSHYPSQLGNKYTIKSKAAVADIEVTLIETHANIRILSKKNPRQLSKLVSGFHTLRLTILHLNVTSLGSLVLYSISAKVEEGCQLNSVDSIAEAVHHMLSIIEEDATSLLLTY